MTMRSMARVVGAVALVAALALGSTTAPAAADPADVYLPHNTLSPQYSLGGCLYKVIWGNFGSAPYARVAFYNLSACGGALVAVQYHDGTSVVGVNSTTVTGTGSDGCGAYQLIQATGGVGFAVRALLWVGTGVRWYDADGLDTQPIHSTC